MKILRQHLQPILAIIGQSVVECWGYLNSSESNQEFQFILSKMVSNDFKFIFDIIGFKIVDFCS